jgi:nucleoprotein TPR
MISQTVVLHSQDLRSQLGQERDSVRHVSLQKEIEVKDLQTRLEKSVRMSSSTHLHVTNPVLD